MNRPQVSGRGTGRAASDALSRLASALGRNDEQPNIALAEEIAARLDRGAIEALVVSLFGPDRAVRSDAIKVLYEVGEREPALIAPDLPSFLRLLESRENRLVWGAMCAIDAISAVRPADVYAHLSEIRAAAQRGTVITRDHAVKAMVKLTAHPRLARTVVPLLLDEVRTCPVNQLPMYAELAGSVVTDSQAGALRRVIEDRLKSVHQVPKRRRLERVLKRLQAVRLRNGPGRG